MKFDPCGPRTFSNSRCSGKGFADLNRERRGRDQGRQRRQTAIKSLKNCFSLDPQGEAWRAGMSTLGVQREKGDRSWSAKESLGVAHRKGKPRYALGCDPKLVAIIGGTAMLEKTGTDGVI